MLVWLDEENPKLGGKALRLIDRNIKEDRLAVSAISFWEVAMLVRKGRLDMMVQPGVWRNDLLENGLGEIPMDGRIGLRAASLRELHGDPADRIIVATAQERAATLVTADRNILSWRGNLKTVDARF